MKGTPVERFMAKVPQHCSLPMIHVEIPFVYDGALFLLCESCGGWAYRHPAGHYLRARAERVARQGVKDWRHEMEILSSAEGERGV